MSLRIILRATAIAALFGLVAFALPGQDQSSDDVAAAARKAREQQKNAPKPKKVLTNDDIAPVDTSTPAEAAEGKTGGQGGAAKGQGQKTDKGEESNTKGEAYWRKRFGTVREKLAKSEVELDVLQRELNTDQVQYYPDPQKALMQQHDRADINEKTAKIDAKKKEIDALKQQLSDMEDDLRKAGGDPGWAR
jgi:parvulin-like peptidyl-prolyl isomerase